MLLIGTLLPEAAEGQAGKAGAVQDLGKPLWGARPHKLLGSKGGRGREGGWW